MEIIKWIACPPPKHFILKRLKLVRIDNKRYWYGNYLPSIHAPRIEALMSMIHEFEYDIQPNDLIFRDFKQENLISLSIPFEENDLLPFCEDIDLETLLRERFRDYL